MLALFLEKSWREKFPVVVLLIVPVVVDDSLGLSLNRLGFAVLAHLPNQSQLELLCGVATEEG